MTITYLENFVFPFSNDWCSGSLSVISQKSIFPLKGCSLCSVANLDCQVDLIEEGMLVRGLPEISGKLF